MEPTYQEKIRILEIAMEIARTNVDNWGEEYKKQYKDIIKLLEDKD